MRTIVSGSRGWDWYSVFEKAMDDVLSELQVRHSLGVHEIGLVHGGARGTDAMCQRYAESRQIKTKIFSAEWDNIEEKKVSLKSRPTDGSLFNNLAGVQRNIKMLDFINNSKDKYVIAFQDGEASGVGHMVGASMRAKIPLYRFSISNGVRLKLDVFNCESILIRKYRG